MVRKYFEIIEQLSDEEALTKQAQMIRLEVKDEQEAKTKAQIYEGAFEGLNYKKRFHIHRLNEEEGCVIKNMLKGG